MATWLSHPQYASVRDRLIESLRSPGYRFRAVDPVVFLCGGADSSTRDTLAAYLRRRDPPLQVFYAEQVWELISARSSRSALEMEDDLAGLSDLVIIIVESPGTFTELGAFSLSPALRRKLLPIVDIHYRADRSFISTGPLRWVDAESLYRPTVYVPLVRILDGTTEFEQRIKQIPKPEPASIIDLRTSRKHLLFFLCDLVSVIQPASAEVVEYYIDRIASSGKTSMDVSTLLALSVAMGLLTVKVVKVRGESETLFSAARPDALIRPYHHRKRLDLPSQRAAHVGVLLQIPEAAEAMRAIRGVT